MNNRIKYILLVLMFFIMCLTGCGRRQEIKDRLNADITVEDRTGDYIYEQTITMFLNNGYRCVDSNVEFDEETNQYTVMIKVSQPMG